MSGAPPVSVSEAAAPLQIALAGDPALASLSTAGEIVVSLCLIIGASFALIGSIGMITLRDFYMRLHAPTKSSTLGVGATLVGSSVFYTLVQPGVSLHEILVAFFLFMTAPVSAHLMAKAALHLGLRNESGAPEGAPAGQTPGGRSARDAKEA